MSTQALTEYLARPRRIAYERQLKRMFKRQKKQLLHEFVATRRKIRINVRRWHRQQYFLTNSIMDISVGFKMNQDILLGVCLAGTILLYAVLIAGTQATYFAYLSAITLADVTNVPMILILGWFSGILTLLALWLAAFLFAALGTGLMQSFRRKVYRSLIATLREGLRNASRLASAWIVMGIVYVLPVAMLGIVILAMLSTKLTTVKALTPAAPYLLVAALTWVVYISMRYLMVPQIILYEKPIRYGAAFTRCEELTRTRGRVFQLIVMCMTVGLGFALYAITSIVSESWGLTFGPLFGLQVVLILALSHLVLTALYRKRAAARRLV